VPFLRDLTAVVSHFRLIMFEDGARLAGDVVRKIGFFEQ
jgi:hypothetical protein